MEQHDSRLHDEVPLIADRGPELEGDELDVHHEETETVDVDLLDVLNTIGLAVNELFVMYEELRQAVLEIKQAQAPKLVVPRGRSR